MYVFAGIALFMPRHATSSVLITTNQSVETDVRSINKVEPIQVECPVGTAPRLPFQVMVTYTNGKSELRQTKWSNSVRSTEEDQANPETHPVGHNYTVNGFIIGDNTTANGFPITAAVKVVAQAYVTPSNSPIAEAISMDKVKIIGNNRLTSNRELAIRTIASWDVSQFIYNYRDTYGLSTEGYTLPAGWDSPTTKLKGHGSGHYMSALAFAFVSTTDPQVKKTLRNNITRMVNELRECQEQTFVWDEDLGRYWEARDFAPEEEIRTMKGTWEDFDIYKKNYDKYGHGYLNAIPAQHPILSEMYRPYNNAEWVWAPYYTIHKQLAGLIDIATYIDDPEVAGKAILIAKDMGMWVWNRLHYRTYVKTDGTQEERRARPGNRYETWNMYMTGEDGGMSESLARLAEMAKDPLEKERLIQASNYFDSPMFYDPLAVNVDDVRTRHANTHIPKIIGALRSYRTNSNPYYYNLVENFWTLIQGRYRYSSGGVGNGELFRQPYTQILSMATNDSPNINETCCAYNLVKLSKDLNCFDPDNAAYMDYYERVLYNQIVGSLHHTDYMTTYQYAVGLNASKPWGNQTPQSSCCGGTGSENHVKYQEATYFASENTLWVALYLPTELQWDAKNTSIQQDCLWPAESSKIRVTKGGANFSMKLRVPYWATEGFDVKLNGVSVANSYQPSSYVTIPARDWTTSDLVEVIMPFSKHIDFGPDKLETATEGRNQPNLQFTPAWTGTLMYGPLAMTATGVNNWDDATLTVDSYLESIVLNGPSGGTQGANGNLYTLTQGGKTFEPDYYRSENSTHYFQINLVGDMITEFRDLLSVKLNDISVFQPKNYTKASYKALKSAADGGRKLYSSKKATQNGITSQIALIDDAINGLKTKKLDKSVLTATLNEAASKNSMDYTWDKYAALQMAMVSGKEVNTKDNSQLAVDKQILTLHKAMEDLVLVSSIDKTSLNELLALGIERKNAQEAWNALEVKASPHAPWAPHAYRRLVYQIEKSQNIFDNKEKNSNQNDVNLASAALNAAINTMRPGHLPEPEDLYPLSTLLRQAGRVIPSEVTPTLTEAMEYAKMVTDYVNEGSGTHDMIFNAVDKMKEALN